METPESLVRRNVRDLREQRRHTVRSLSALLGELGRPILPSGITKIEDGSRRVDVGDLVALAIALGVNPNRLLLPVAAPKDEDIALTPAVKARQSQAWSWARGESLLLAGEVASGRDDRPWIEGQDDFRRHALPPSERLRESHTAVKAARDVLDRVHGLLDWQDERDRTAERRPGEDPDPQGILPKYAGDLRRALARLTAEVDDLIGDDDGDR